VHLKQRRSQQGSANPYLAGCTEPWDTVKAQFLNEISDALSPPPQIHFDHYEFSFKISRAVSEPMQLVSGGDYEFLVQQSTKGKSASNVKV
jgi:hypothetical protein